MNKNYPNPKSTSILILDKMMELVLLTLLISTAILFISKAENSFLLPKEIYFRLSIFFLTAFWLAKMAISARLIFFKSPLNLPLILLLILSLVSLTYAQSPNLTYRNLINLAAAISLYLIIIDVISTETQLRKLLFVLVCLAGFTALYGIFQFYGIDHLRYWIGNVGRQRLFSTFGNPNFLAEYLICLLPVSFIMVSIGRKKIGKVICSLSFLISSLALLISQTRGAWLGAFISFIFMGMFFVFKDRTFLKENKKIILAIPAVILAVCLIFIMLNIIKNNPGDNEALARRTKIIFRDPFRDFVWEATAHMFQDHPFLGVGLGNFRLHYPDYQAQLLSSPPYPDYIIEPNVSRVHNDYLQAASELGIPGLLIVCWMAIALIWHGLRVFMKTNDITGRRLLVGILSGCIALLTYTFFSFSFHLASTSSVFICLAAMLTSVGRIYGTSMPKVEICLPFLRFKVISCTLIAVSLATAIFLSSNALKILIADEYLKSGFYMINKNNNLDLTEKILNRGMRLNPAEGKFNFALAVIKEKKGDSEAAINELHQALRSFRDVSVYHNLGSVYMRTGQLELAKKYWQKAVAIRPNSTKTLLFLGRACRKDNELDQAEKWFKQAVHYDSNNGEANYLLATVYKQQNRTRQASEYFRKAFELIPSKAGKKNIGSDNK